MILLDVEINVIFDSFLEGCTSTGFGIQGKGIKCTKTPQTSCL
jgi:hypothetical protein